MTRIRLLFAAAAFLVVMFAVVVPAFPAQAHTELSRTVPAAKSTTINPVTAVTLTFSGLIKKPGTTVVVTGPDKVSYSDAAPQVRDKTITQQVNPLPVGAVTVAWRTVAADGHPIQGSFTFTNRAAPPTPSTEPNPTPDAAATTPASAATTPAGPVPAAGQDSDDGSSVAPLVWAIAVVAVLAFALLGGLLWRRRRSTGS